MKKITLHFVALLLLSFSIVACKKDSYTDQLSNNWASTAVQVSDLALAGNFAINLNLYPNNQFTALYKIIKPVDDTLIVNLAGTWQEDFSKKQFTLHYNDGSIETYRIMELTAGKMRAETMLEHKTLTVTFKSEGATD